MGSNSINAGHVCKICSAPSDKRCLGCQTVYYCSQKHQKEDWEIHKESCPAYKIDRNDKLGRYLVATRNISKGAIIFREEALTFGPKIYSPPICLGCHRRVNGSYFCSRCGFPMCSAICESVQIHRENECKIFERKGSKPKNISNYNALCPLYQSILALRCLLLKETSPDKWKLLNSMEHHVVQRKATSDIWEEYQINIVKFLRDWNDLEMNYSEDLINEIIGFIEVNSFQICTVRQVEFCGMFFLGGMMSHNCVPNTHHAFDESGTMIMRASIPIKKGEEITVSYVDTEFGTLDRQTILQRSKYFTCSCARCSDPTELGTFISGIKCLSCNSGYLLPQNPFDVNTNWECYNTNSKLPNISCKPKLKATEAKEILNSIENDIKENTIKSSETSLQQGLKSGHQFLHPNHYLLLPIRNSLVKIYKSDYASANATVIAEQQKVISDLLDVYNTLTPGLNRTRGLLLLQQWKLRKRILELRINGGEIDEAECTLETSSIAKAQKELEKLFELDLMIGVTM